MKKKEVLIFLGIVLLAVLVSCGVVFLNKKFENKNVKENKRTEQESSQVKGNMYYELKDRYIYSHGLNSIKFTYNNETKELKEWFKKDKNFLDKFIKALETMGEYNDGGTIMYKDGGTKLFNLDDMVVIVCKRIDNDGYNNNIHIGKNLKYENDVCYMPRKGND